MAKSIEKNNVKVSEDIKRVSQGDDTSTQSVSSRIKSRLQETPPKQQELDFNATAINPADQKVLAKVGSIIATGDLEVTVSSLTVRELLGEDSFAEARASKGGVYLVADWTYKNATRSPMSSFSNPAIRLISPDNIEYKADLGATAARASEIDVNEKTISNLNPGITVQSTAVFEVSRELLSELGWKIQIKYNGSVALYEVDSAGLLGIKPKSLDIADSAAPDPDRSTVQVGDPAQNDRESLVELKGELAAVDAKMNADRARYRASTDTINRLTNFKRTPVREGSPEYYRCLEASKIIQEIEAGAGELKAKKAQLETTIKALEE